MLIDTLQTLVDALKNAGYKVVTKPQELKRPNELHVDIAGIDIEDYYTGGVKVAISYIITWLDKDRSAFLDKCEDIIKIVNTPIYVVTDIDTDIDGECVVGFLTVRCVEVIEFGE